MFDISNDPHELNNLAENPAYRNKLLELRQACEDWIISINDTGMKPELQLLAELWPNHTQPQTAIPVISTVGSKVNISCETEGASIGYKILEPDDDPAKKSWSVYIEPMELSENSELIAVAHRIGYKRSTEVNLTQ